MSNVNELPYVVNDDGTVAALKKTYLIGTGETLELVVPLPKGPDEGWPDGGLTRYMKMLEQKSAPMIRSAVKKQFGTTKYRLLREEAVSVPAETVLLQQVGMMQRQKGGR